MLDPRIYRMSLVAAALALVVLAFSLADQPGALRSTLAPSAFDGGNVSASMRSIARAYPARAPGSPTDARLASRVAAALGSATDGFSVTTDRFPAAAPAGARRLVDVVATRPGTSSSSGSIVVVAPRDAPGLVGASGTATLLELGRDLGGETLRRTVVLASTTGSGAAGNAGAMRLAATLPRPVDAVIVLGDVASAQPGQPVLVPWTTREAIAPPQLRTTLAAALGAQSSVRAGPPGTLAQLAHLAFPLTISAQGPFGAVGMPAVQLSLSGERGPEAGAPALGAGQLGAVGRAVLSSITALDAGGAIAAPSADVLFKGKLVPEWAVSLFVLALILPVALTVIDGVARARRRRYLVGRSLAAVLTAAGPFLAAAVVIVLGRALGAMSPPAGATGPGTVGVSGGAIAVMALALLAALGCGVGVRSAFGALGDAQTARGLRGSRDWRAAPVDRSGDGIAAAMLLVLCVVTLLVWLANPFAAALLVPALHLWLWALDSDLALPAPARGVMLAAGGVPVAGLVVFYAHSLGFGAGALAWEAVLLVAGHVVSWAAVLEWSVVLGCLVTGVGLVVAAARRRAVAPAATVTVRGPVSYAGPGSLGGTESALRR